jgi:glycosyltransferase involved in cell wall biosynthesis
VKVLQVMAGAALGGAETYFVDMVTALHRAGLDQKVVIRRNARRAAGLREAGIDPVELPFGGWFDFRTRPLLARLIADWQPDIVQSWMNRATRFVSRPEGARFVHVGWFGGYYKVANYRNCDHLVGVTPDIRDHQIAGGWPADRAHYIPTFADAARAAPVSRAAFGTPDDAPLFLALGRLHEKKAFDILIRAASELPAAHVWIAGEGELRGALERLIAELGLTERVRLLGWRDDRAALFAAADYCVMPSRYEPFGTVMIEAWAQDVPLICARAKGPLGLIQDGADGLLVPIDDAPALALAMGRLIDDPALTLRLAAAGRAAFERDFTEAAVARRYRDFYAEITGA